MFVALDVNDIANSIEYNYKWIVREPKRSLILSLQEVIFWWLSGTCGKDTLLRQSYVDVRKYTCFVTLVYELQLDKSETMFWL